MQRVAIHSRQHRRSLIEMVHSGPHAIEWHNRLSVIHCAGDGATEGYKEKRYVSSPQFSTTRRETRQSASAAKPTTPPSHPTPKDTTSGTALTSAETNRRDELNNHPHIGWLKAHTVFCKLCTKEIALDKVSRYAPHNWEIHQRRNTHQNKIPKDKIQAEEVAVDSASTRGKKRKRDSEVKVERVMKSRASTAKPPIPPKDWNYEDEVEDRVAGNDNKENENPCNADVESILPKEVPLALPVRFKRKSYG
ncbi:hypothetical protein BDZ89DRAFT_1219362 [Hymenopellis radicata]|nr:hypothetical protein BDZ89DRAFT_1219362 [Hymenopellis radicata]